MYINKGQDERSSQKSRYTYNKVADSMRAFGESFARASEHVIFITFRGDNSRAAGKPQRIAAKWLEQAKILSLSLSFRIQ